MMQSREKHGLAALEAMFATAKSQGRAAFLPYFPIGYPSYGESLQALAAMADAGADGFEIGISFSDPIADGPTIQAATQIALENGTTVRNCLEAVRQLRDKGINQPMLMMGYANPLVAYGTDQFVRDAREAGADGLIVPDVPPEEAAMFAGSCAREGLALIFMLAPTSNNHRIKVATRHATGFLYVVSLDGDHRRAGGTAVLSDRIHRSLAFAHGHAAGLGVWHRHAGTCQTGEQIDGRLHRWLRSGAGWWRECCRGARAGERDAFGNWLRLKCVIHSEKSSA